MQVKKGETVVWASNFTLYTSNSAEGRGLPSGPAGGKLTPQNKDWNDGGPAEET